MRRPLIAILAALALALALAACDAEDDGEDPATDEDAAPDDEGATDQPAEGAFPVTVTDGRGVDVEIETRPERIVSLSPTHTEIVYAVGAGDQVVAVDEWSTHPEEAPTTDLSAFDPNVEAILAEEPDLVLLADAPGLAEEIEAVDVDVLAYEAASDLDDAWDQMRSVGEATGHPDAAEELVADLRAEVDEIVADVPETDEPLTFFHELDDTQYTVTSDTFIGEVYALLGLENIADGADEPFPQLSAEAVIDADPDLVFIAHGDPEAVGQRPGWDGLSAVDEGSVYAVDGDQGSRWGPRIVDFMEEVAGHVRDTVERRG